MYWQVVILLSHNFNQQGKLCAIHKIFILFPPFLKMTKYTNSTIMHIWTSSKIDPFPVQYIMYSPLCPAFSCISLCPCLSSSFSPRAVRLSDELRSLVSAAFTPIKHPQPCSIPTVINTSDSLFCAPDFTFQ